jgi:hypothetical protein
MLLVMILFFPQILSYFRPKYWDFFGNFFPTIVNSTNIANFLKKISQILDITNLKEKPWLGPVLLVFSRSFE